MNEIKIYLRFNKKSKSNGSLMRITPLAVWCRNLKNEKNLATAINETTLLTHFDETIKLSNYLYVLAIINLINTKGDMRSTYDLINTTINKPSNYLYKAYGKAFSEIKEWWNLVENNIMMPGKPQDGFTKIAWTYSFLGLKNQEKNILKGIKHVLLQNGDTDTNACIYGGMIGAAIGFNNIPEDCVKKLLNFKYDKQKRPKLFHPKNIVYNIENLMENSPENENFKHLLFSYYDLD